MRDLQTDGLIELPQVDNLLGPLVADIQRTRQALRDLLDSHPRATHLLVLGAREDSKAALERFVTTLVEHRLPVPRQIHDELGLMRRLCAHTRAPYRTSRSDE